jgi:hypothetical protein
VPRLLGGAWPVIEGTDRGRREGVHGRPGRLGGEQ